MGEKKIRVLHFSQVINKNDFIDIIVRYADPEKFEMLAAAWTSKSNIADTDYAKDGIFFKAIDIDRMSARNMLRGAWRLSRILRSENIQVLHAHHFYETVMGMLACLLHPRTRLVFGRHYHNEFHIDAKGLKQKIYLATEKIAGRFSAKIIVPSIVIKDLIKEQGGIPMEKVEVIYYGFDFLQPKYRVETAAEKKEMRTRMGWDKTSVLIGNFARHHYMKGHIYLLDAFKEYIKTNSSARLILVGDGPLHTQLRQWVEEKGLGAHVEFLGWRKDAPALMNLMDMVVHPTLQEAFAQTMIEVMSLKIPLLITPVAGAVDVVKDGQNAFLIEMKSAKSIGEKIDFVRTNPSVASRVAENGQSDVFEKFSYEKIIPLYEQVYESVIKN